MTLDANTLIPLGVAVPCVLWAGRQLMKATTAWNKNTIALTALSERIEHLADTKVGKREFSQWMERLGYKNPELHVPAVPEQERDAA